MGAGPTGLAGLASALSRFLCRARRRRRDAVSGRRLRPAPPARRPETTCTRGAGSRLDVGSLGPPGSTPQPPNPLPLCPPED